MNCEHLNWNTIQMEFKNVTSFKFILFNTNTIFNIIRTCEFLKTLQNSSKNIILLTASFSSK